jgi:small subunit ribosomal protein S18
MADKNVRYLNPISIDTQKEKYCRFKKKGIKYIDYKDASFLLMLCNEQGKILPRRLTGTSLKFQRKRLRTKFPHPERVSDICHSFRTEGGRRSHQATVSQGCESDGIGSIIGQVTGRVDIENRSESRRKRQDLWFCQFNSIG